MTLMFNRVVDHPVLGKLEMSDRVTFTFDGKEYEGIKGESVAAALLANDIRILRKHEESGRGRGIYCNIGHCFECRVTVGDKEGVRACLTPLEEHMNIFSGIPLPTPIKDWGDHHE